MSWHVFYTPWGWAAVLGENKNIKKSVLPTLDLPNLREYIEQTGLDARFVLLPDYSLPVVNKFCAYYEGVIINSWDIGLAWRKRLLMYLFWMSGI
jgi:hypothetical protein